MAQTAQTLSTESIHIIKIASPSSFAKQVNTIADCKIKKYVDVFDGIIKIQCTDAQLQELKKLIPIEFVMPTATDAKSETKQDTGPSYFPPIVRIGKRPTYLLPVHLRPANYVPLDKRPDYQQPHL